MVKIKKHIIVFFCAHTFIFSLLLFFSPKLYGNNDSTSCRDVQQRIEKKIATAEKQFTSIKSLLAGDASDYPIELLLQVNLDSQAQIDRRVKEIEVMASSEAVMKSAELSDLVSCFDSPKDNASIAKLSQILSDLNAHKLEFYRLKKEKRDILLESYLSQRAQKADRLLIDAEVRKAEARRSQSQMLLAEPKTSEELKNTSESLWVAISSLRQYNIDFSNEQIEFLKEIAEESEKLESIRARLHLALKTEQSEKLQIESLVKDSTAVWRDTADFISDLFNSVGFSRTVDLPNLVAPTTMIEDGDKELYAQYLKDYEEAKKERTQQAQKRTDILDDLRSQSFRLLSEAGQLRSRLFSSCDALESCSGHRELNADNLNDILRELKIVPVKVKAGALSKAIEFKDKFQAGIDGWINLAQQSVALLLLLLIPLLLFKSLGFLREKLESTRKQLLSRSLMDFRKRTSIAVWLSRVNPFVPAVGMTIAVWLSRVVVEGTDLSELSNLLFYLQLYFIYRIFKILLRVCLELLFSSDSVLEGKKKRELTKASARRISRVVFLEYALIYLIETSVRKALVYGIFYKLFTIFNVLYFFWESYHWRTQIFETFSQRFPSHSAHVKRLESKKIYVLLACPFLALTIIARDLLLYLYSRLIKFDFFKRLHSELFKRKLETEVDESKYKEPSKDYLAKFDYYLPAASEIFVERENSPVITISELYKAWHSSKGNEDLLLIVGNRGMGKTTVLNSFAQSIGANARSVKAPPKILSVDALFAFLSELTGKTLSSVDEFFAYDQSLIEKTVFIIDDIQNLFLAKIGGFDAYKAWVEILSLKTRNIFWCLAVNSRSWGYLKGVFGAEHLYGRMINLGPWRDFEIQNLILSRHQLTNYDRQFDKAIKAYGTSDASLGQQAEAQFFRLLWGQSRGNPRSALMYWISAVSETGNKEVTVGVPSFVDSSLVSSMSDESLFLLASIARHDSMTSEELADVTKIQGSVIRKCLKEALDKDLVWVDESSRYRVSSRAQYVIDYYLIGKNFLYE